MGRNGGWEEDAGVWERSWSQEVFVCGKRLWRPASLKFEGRGELTST